jgi:hypothetical protein
VRIGVGAAQEFGDEGGPEGGLHDSGEGGGVALGGGLGAWRACELL